MKLLLDTHMWIWSVMEPKRISRRVSSALSKSTNELWLSPVSTWEIITLCRKGRLNLKQEPVPWIEAVLAEVPIHHAPVTHEVALATRGVWLPNHDPLDLLLAATAKAYDLTLVTADQQILAGKGFAVLANR